MSQVPQDGSKLVDQLDYEKLCIEKQRKIDELEGMLEQRSGFLRRGLAKVGRALKSKMAIAIFCGLIPLTAISAGVYLKIFKPVYDAAKKPVAKITDLIPYDCYKVMGLDEKRDVLELENPNTGERHFVHVCSETIYYIQRNNDKYTFDDEFIADEKNFDVVDLHSRWGSYRSGNEGRIKELEKIRQEASSSAAPAEAPATK